MSESNRNEITGDKLQSKVGNPKAYTSGWERIFDKRTPCCSHEEASQKEIQKEQCHSSGCCGECS